MLEKFCNHCHWALISIPFFALSLIFPGLTWPIQTRASHLLPGPESSPALSQPLPSPPVRLLYPCHRKAGLPSQHPTATRQSNPGPWCLPEQREAVPAHSCRRWAMFVHKSQHLVPNPSIASRRISHCPSQSTGLPVFPSIRSIFNCAWIIKDRFLATELRIIL